MLADMDSLKHNKIDSNGNQGFSKHIKSILFTWNTMIYQSILLNMMFRSVFAR